MLKKLTILFTTFVSFFSVSAELNNKSFSYIGFAVGELSYKESGTLSSGLYFETNPKTINIFNQSGGYTAINKRAGFYINTVSTLTSSSEDEYWKATGSVNKDNISNSVNGIYQNNSTSSAHNELDILLGYLLAPGHQVVFGGSVTRALMDRNSFGNGFDSHLDDFNNAHLTPAIGNTNVFRSQDPSDETLYQGAITDPTTQQEVGAVDLNNNGILELNELVATYGNAPEDSIVNYTETFTAVIAQAGYFYDSRFASDAPGFRLLGGVLVGVPLYYDVVNTSRPSLGFTESANGFNFKSYIGAGWRFNKNFGVVAKADYFFRYRDRVNVSLGFNEELQRNQTAFIPENEVQYFTFNLMAYWNFD